MKNPAVSEVKFINHTNDYSEFFSREKVEDALEKIDDFDDTTDIIATYKTIKELYSKREIEVKKIVHSFIQNYVKAVNDFEFIRSASVRQNTGKANKQKQKKKNYKKKS